MKAGDESIDVNQPTREIEKYLKALVFAKRDPPSMLL